MCPLKVTSNGISRVLGSNGGIWKTPDNLEVFWSDDESSNAHVYDHRFEKIGEFNLPVKGTQTELSYQVHVAPVELGEPTTPVTRSIRLERI